MISAAIIRTLAAQARIDPGIAEKDYVLSKMLMALSQVDGFQDALVLKGGTALKKCYYPGWRFSEDLDFTARGTLKPGEIERMFGDAPEIAIRQSGLPLRVIEYSRYPKAGDKLTAAQLKLGYDGPLRKSSGQKNNIRVDIALDEKILSEPVTKRVHRQFPDDVEAEIPVYSLEEIVGEKMRSILERGKSRDYYDVWLLLASHQKDFSVAAAVKILARKCRHRGLARPALDDFFDPARTDEARRYWERGLANQVADLPEFDSVIRELRRLIGKAMSERRLREGS